MDRLCADQTPRRPRMVRARDLGGPVPESLRAAAIEHDGKLLAPLTKAVAETLREQTSARADAAAERCLSIVECGEVPPPARLVYFRGVDGEQLRWRLLGSGDPIGFRGAPGRGRHAGGHARPLDGRGARRLHRPPRGRGHTPGSRGVRGAARRAAGRRPGGPPVPRDHGDPIPRSRRCSVASSRRSSGPGCATRSRHGARSWPTSRVSARRSRRSRRSRPTTPSRRSSSARRR